MAIITEDKKPTQADAIKIADTTQTPAAAPTIDYAKKVDNATLTEDRNKTLVGSPKQAAPAQPKDDYSTSKLNPANAPEAVKDVKSTMNALVPFATNGVPDPEGAVRPPPASSGYDPNMRGAPSGSDYREDSNYKKNPIPNSGSGGQPAANSPSGPIDTSSSDMYNPKYLQKRAEAQTLGQELKSAEVNKDPKQFQLISGKLGSLMLNLGDLGSVNIGNLVRDVMQGIAKSNYAYAGKDYETQLEKEFATKQALAQQMGQAEATKSVAGGTTEEVQSTLISKQRDADIMKANNDYSNAVEMLKRQYSYDEKNPGYLRALEALKGDYSTKIANINGYYGTVQSGLTSPNPLVSGSTFGNQDIIGKKTKPVESLVKPAAPKEEGKTLPPVGSQTTGAAKPGAKTGVLEQGWSTRLKGANADGGVTGSIAGKAGAQQAAGAASPIKAPENK